MFIRINNNNRVTACIYKPTKNFEVDGVTTFEVESVPDREENTTLHFNPETKEFYTQEVDTAIVDERKARAEAQAKKAEAMKWLTDNDWKVNKRMLGEWAENDERWIAYLEGRAKARAAIDAADAILNG